MLVTVAVTITIAFLFSSESVRGNKFYLSLITLVFAETLLFFHPIQLTLRGEQSRNTLPISFGSYIVYVFYAIGVSILVAVALTSVSFNVLLAFHLILFLGLCLFIGGTSISGIFADSNHRKNIKERVPMISFKTSFANICDRLAILEFSAVKDLTRKYQQFRDENLEYVTSQSIPGSENVDNEMTSFLSKIDVSITELENQCQTDTEKIQNENDVISQIELLAKMLDKLTQILERRENVISHLR